MIKRILLALDKSPAGETAQKYAIDLATKSKASITGIGVLDTPWITAAQPEPIGGGAYKLQRDATVIGQSHELLALLISEFMAACAAKGVNHSSLEVEGFPTVEIERLAHEHDLIIIGRTTDFHFDLEENSDVVVKHIARDNPRPLIILPETIHDTDNILVTFDGSMQSSRAMHMFILLGLAQGKKIHVVSIDKNIDIATTYTRFATRMFQAHDLTITPHALVSEGDTAKQLMSIAHDLKASMMVMGGFSHSILRETLFGSCTKTLMAQSDIPIFLHH
jgi:nucleotide-binding universal stress UspA family protein